MASLTWVAAGCTTLGGLLFAAFLWDEAPHAADFREITYNLGWAAAAITGLEVIGLLLDWGLAWLLAVPIGGWLVFIGIAPLAFDEFAGAPAGGLIGLAGLGLIGCVLLRIGRAIAERTQA